VPREFKAIGSRTRDQYSPGIICRRWN